MRKKVEKWFEGIFKWIKLSLKYLDYIEGIA